MIDFILSKFSLMREERVRAICRCYIKYMTIYFQKCVLKDFGRVPDKRYMNENLDEFEKFFKVANKTNRLIKDSYKLDVREGEDGEYEFFINNQLP